MCTLERVGEIYSFSINIVFVKKVYKGVILSPVYERYDVFSFLNVRVKPQKQFKNPVMYVKLTTEKEKNCPFK